ncbi:MAG: hypothetical protein J1E34_02255 [Oscillospiraceae bacterium]|nr:hypothetical protein [Oscillospiraceae bacterium]
MRIKPLLAGILAVSLLSAVFSSCNFTLPHSGPDPETEESSEPTSSEALFTEEPTSDEQRVSDVSDEPESTAAGGFTEVNSFREVALDKAGVIELYTKTVNEVKIRCPGFKRTDYQTFEETSANSGLQLANRILSLVASELLGEGGSSVQTVQPHSDIEVIEKFPIYNQSYACDLTDLSIIDSAVCYTDGVQDRIVITVANTINPRPVTSDFGKILNPVNRENVAGGIASYLTKLDLDKYLFDFNYTGNEITCVIDRESGRIKSLTQKMIIKVDINLDIDLFFFVSNLIEAHGTVISKTEFTEFDWS